MGFVSISYDGCSYAGVPPYGNCGVWVLRFAFQAKGRYGISRISSSDPCLCTYGNCVVPTACAGGLVTLCKNNGQRDPRGTYGACAYPVEFCTDYDGWNCDPAASVVVS
jgi:hypothetical protein